MKRLVIAAVMGVIAFSLTACGERAPQKPEMNTEAAQPAEATTAVEQPAANEAEAAGATAQE